MASSTHRTTAPQSSMSGHAQMLTPATHSSGILSRPVKCEIQPQCVTPVFTTSGFSFRSTPPTEINGNDSGPTFKPVSGLTAGSASSPTNSPRLERRLTSRETPEVISSTVRLTTPRNTSPIDMYRINASPSASSSLGSGLKLKLKLRGIQEALKEQLKSTDSSRSRVHNSVTGYKRVAVDNTYTDEYDTDSEIDLMLCPEKKIKPAARRQTARSTSRKAKKAKITYKDSDGEDDDAIFDAGDEDSSHISPDHKLTLSTNILKRSERILDPSKPEHAKLIAAATKAGSEYYDSDADDLPGDVKETNKPHLFRNVKWGKLANDYSNSTDFTTEPEFTQFVPGRFERLPDGTASDQKSKLIVKLFDKSHRQRIFLNPPPRDWNNQEAITALNKRTVQQIRRNTSIRFREVVEPYVKEEREWILAHLTEGKPSKGWKRFVDEFNKEFEGKKLNGADMVRPERSHSSLTKEVERFGKMYSKGIVPRTTLQGAGKRKGKGKKNQ